MKNQEKGFTIIELVVVIAIIGILATVILINVAGYINRSKDSTLQQNMRTLQTNAISNSVSASGTDFSDACSETLGDYNATVIGKIKGTQSNFACMPYEGSLGFCACVQYVSTTTPQKYFYVDSTGKAEEREDSCIAECTTPAP